MNNIFANIRAYFARLSHQSQQDAAQRVQQAAEREANTALQIREFQGALFLSFNDRPILPVLHTNESTSDESTAVEILKLARCTYSDYLTACEINRHQ
jgi:hypothetical protein|nr:MAG TPA: hypothetical protein [Caudoviricetes sp.]